MKYVNIVNYMYIYKRSKLYYCEYIGRSLRASIGTSSDLYKRLSRVTIYSILK